MRRMGVMCLPVTQPVLMSAYLRVVSTMTRRCVPQYRYSRDQKRSGIMFPPSHHHSRDLNPMISSMTETSVFYR